MSNPPDCCVTHTAGRQAAALAAVAGYCRQRTLAELEAELAAAAHPAAAADPAAAPAAADSAAAAAAREAGAVGKPL
ncbi:hypothetical protein MNEG_7966 [Monoraphidium neglectum]|uniref:Uncharacterized protein n=1 Tax=Monoraphidium neglectum TaxID=145388 RepID=A0A0D2MH30_9CHLO|nr:hypothetical protein MNEG_7966 [Monoraphidium neglectum]KIY99996.1 hypothetical protein MNEG_7966 [Monoraphidium neglectum]|eukprot:XP_013899016.1 hypothetical protein MNEG_7966 [Monoraphidium neglectum]